LYVTNLIVFIDLVPPNPSFPTGDCMF
jgi:hypothetical protein